MNFKEAIANENHVDRVVDNRSKISPKKVYINKLISRHNKERTKEKIETLIFVGLACVLVIVSGILVSF